MEIYERERAGIDFGELKRGEVFRFGEKTYMKTMRLFTTKYVNPMTAICLDNGEPAYFGYYVEVHPYPNTELNLGVQSNNIQKQSKEQEKEDYAEDDKPVNVWEYRSGMNCDDCPCHCDDCDNDEDDEDEDE